MNFQILVGVGLIVVLSSTCLLEFVNRGSVKVPTQVLAEETGTNTSTEDVNRGSGRRD
ncbi:MAG: hypothetical protein RLZZ532_4322 [Cyanobacteriota bacterium]|jgi:hypothetical protein